MRIARRAHFYIETKPTHLILAYDMKKVSRDCLWWFQLIIYYSMVVSSEFRMGQYMMTVGKMHPSFRWYWDHFSGNVWEVINQSEGHRISQSKSRYKGSIWEPNLARYQKLKIGFKDTNSKLEFSTAIKSHATFIFVYLSYITRSLIRLERLNIQQFTIV